MKLFEEFRIRDLSFRNRIGVSPMCQYSCENGMPNDWHLVHLGARATGGAGLVMTEATAIEARGRISPADAGIYLDDHIESWAKVCAFLRAEGAVSAIQLAHAGRKASTQVPWLGAGPIGRASGGWDDIVAPSALRFDEQHPVPRELSSHEITEIVKAFAQAAQRALLAKFDVVEIHAAHGYLLHEFLSPLTNTRVDQYGGSFENRIRFLLEVVHAVRAVWPNNLPLFVRISATDWVKGAWDIEQSVALAQHLIGAGVDLIDCSSGAIVPNVRIAVEPNYQVPFASQIRSQAGIATAAVGLITEAQQAQDIVADGHADLVFVGRAMLRDPYWALQAAAKLGEKVEIPKQYRRAW